EVTGQRHQIEFQTTRAAMAGEWDSFRLERVIDNLLGNAIKYSPEDGRIIVRLEQARDEAGSWAVLEIQDFGLGIPAADLPLIFDEFHRGANVLGRVPGMGLGLAGVRHIVDQHGGDVSVFSVEGAGATFTVRLPLPATTAAAEVPSEPTEAGCA
ncbi:MAG: ATP-binding protein, partial [Chloroflexota bacterium]|nr:ATP-binding protein [Chloroflexota bacterium]